MNPAVTRLLIGIALTAGATYLFDPESGRRRRTTLRDRVAGAATRVNDGTRSACREASNRAQRLAGRAKSLFKRDPSTDEAVVRRVRTAIGHTCSRPGVMGVVAHAGQIILHGDVLPQEHEQIVRAVRSVSGVLDVTDHLTERDGLHDPRAPRGFDFRQENWSPGARLLIGSMGSALVAAAIRQRNPLAVLGAVVAVPLLVRSVTNRPLKRLGPGRGVIDVHETIMVDAPVERVYALLEDYENYPAFMRNVRQVIRRDDGTSHWVVAGPAEAPVEWDSAVTVHRPNEMLAWHSVPGSVIEHSGVMRFEAAGADQTRLEIRMSYSPPAGVLGHAIARLFGADPHTELDEDLTRLKRFVEAWKNPVETGRAPREPMRDPGADGAALRRRHLSAAGAPGDVGYRA